MTQAKKIETKTETGFIDMKYSLELSMIEMHILVRALLHYNMDAYKLTKNIDHCDAAEKLSDEVLELY